MRFVRGRFPQGNLQAGHSIFLPEQIKKGKNPRRKNDPIMLGLKMIEKVLVIIVCWLFRHG